MPLPRSPAGASEINRGCDPRSTRPLTRLSPAPWRGAGHRSRLASSPPAFSCAPAGRRGEEVDPHEPGVTPPAISLTPLRGVPPFSRVFAYSVHHEWIKSSLEDYSCFAERRL